MPSSSVRVAGTAAADALAAALGLAGATLAGAAVGLAAALAGALDAAPPDEQAAMTTDDQAEQGGGDADTARWTGRHGTSGWSRAEGPTAGSDETARTPRFDE